MVECCPQSEAKCKKCSVVVHCIKPATAVCRESGVVVCVVRQRRKSFVAAVALLSLLGEKVPLQLVCSSF